MKLSRGTDCATVTRQKLAALMRELGGHVVEIKTPKTQLLGQPYRGNSYSLSKEFSGAISQVLSYKQSLLNEFNSIYVNSGGNVEAFSPRCVVVLGNTNELQTDRTKMGSFENFRACLNGVTVLTYDELLSRVDDLLGILATEDGADDSGAAGAWDRENSDDIPF